jgi:3-methylfumaryl-CoA hydratase
MTASALQLFRYSAVTWNMHRIHYDRDWAAKEGHAGLLVHSHLHAANAIRVLTDGLGTAWQVAHVSYRILRPATEGMCLTATAEVSAVSEDGRELSFLLRETDPNGNICLDGTAIARRR